MMPVQVAIPGGKLRYSTAEIIAQGSNGKRDFLIVYDEPGRVAEIAFAADRAPRVEGGVLYQHWDKEHDSLVLGIRVENREKFLQINRRLLLAVLPRKRALGTWAAQFSSQALPGGDNAQPMDVPWITDAALLVAHGTSSHGVWADLEFRPGEHGLTALLPSAPTKCQVDGSPADFKYDPLWQTARTRLTTPALPAKAVEISSGEFWVERFDPHVGRWEASSLQALDETGLVPYGYVKYRAVSPPAKSSDKLFLTSYAEDARKVFVNGELIADLSNSQASAEAPLAGAVKASGDNVIQISYEAFGTPNFGRTLGELKGIESVKIGANRAGARPLEGWKLARFLALAQPHRLRSIPPSVRWQPATLGPPSGHSKQVPAYTWVRTRFALERLPAAWFAPYRVTVEAERDALLYLNGKFVGRYVTVGPQKDFYLPEPFLNFGGQNELMVLLAYADDPRHVRTLRVSPYEEFATRRTRVEFEA